MAYPERWTTPRDDEALSRYFTARAKADPELRLRMEAAFDAGLDAGERLMLCAERALALVAQSGQEDLVGSCHRRPGRLKFPV